MATEDNVSTYDRRRYCFLLAVFWAVTVAVVVRPAHGQYSLYWGDVHGHTSISDGKGSLDDYFTHARDVAKLDFVVVTDHDFGNAAPWKMPKETWTLTQDKADQYTVNGKFVAIAGYEWTSQPKYWTPEEPLFRVRSSTTTTRTCTFPARWITSSVPRTPPTTARTCWPRRCGSTVV